MTDDPRRRQRDPRRASRCSTRDQARRPAQTATSRVVICVPRTNPRHGNVIYDEAVSTPRRCASTSRARCCASEGIDAIGEVGDPDPYTATMDAIAEYAARRDHHLDLPGRLVGLAAPRPHRAHRGRRRPAGRARRHRPRRRGPAVRASRSSSPTAPPRARRCSRRSRPARTSDEPPRLHRRRARRRAATASHARSARGAPRPGASTALRAAGLVRAGMIGDPDPYTATMNALQFFRVDDIVISTLPETRSGWLRADLIERVRRASNMPVEHVVAEAPTAAEA